MSFKQAWYNLKTEFALKSCARNSADEAGAQTITRFLRVRKEFLKTMELIRTLKFDDAFSLYSLAYLTQNDNPQISPADFLKSLTRSTHDKQTEYQEPKSDGSINLIPLFRHAAQNLSRALENFGPDMDMARNLALSLLPTVDRIVECTLIGNTRNFKYKNMTNYDPLVQTLA